MVELPLLTGSSDARDRLSRVRILYTDLDGTLVAPGGCVLADASGQPSTAVTEQIVALNRAGLTVVPVSGREREQLFELSRLLGWSDFIAEAGAVLVHGDGARGRVTYNNGDWPALPPGAETPYETIAATGAYARLLAAFPGRIEAYSTPERPREATHLLRGCIDAGEAQAVLEGIEPPIDIVDNGALRSRGSLTCEGPAHAYHLVPRGVSKAQAIALDLRSRGLGPEDAAAIGDSATDIEMADSVGVMVLVANALDSPGVQTALAAQPRPNVWRTRGSRGDGWAEFASAWLAAVPGGRKPHRLIWPLLIVGGVILTCAASMIVVAMVVSSLVSPAANVATAIVSESTDVDPLVQPSAEELVGTWKRGDFAITFRADGTFDQDALSWMLGPGLLEGTWKRVPSGVELSGRDGAMDFVPVDQVTSDELDFYFHGVDSPATTMKRER